MMMISCDLIILVKKAIEIKSADMNAGHGDGDSLYDGERWFNFEKITFFILFAKDEGIRMLWILNNKIFLGLNSLKSFDIISIAILISIIGGLFGDKFLNIPPTFILILSFDDIMILINNAEISRFMIIGINQYIHIPNRSSFFRICDRC